jgi:hypothetical protein
MFVFFIEQKITERKIKIRRRKSSGYGNEDKKILHIV